MLGDKRQVAKQFKTFADQIDIVYFGGLDDKDDVEVIKGLSFTPQRRDRSYAHGTYDGFDVSVLHRTSRIERAGTPDEEKVWSIVKLAHRNQRMPEIIITGHHHSRLYFEQLHLKYPTMKAVNQYLQAVNPSFCDLFEVYMPLEDVSLASALLNDSAMQTIFNQFGNFEIELNEDEIFVYFSGDATTDQLKQMLSEAIWFTEHCELILQQIAESE